MAIANVVIADATPATPVNHTFVPIADGKNMRWINDTGAQTLAGQETLAVDVFRSANTKEPHTSSLKIYDPVEVLGVGGTYAVDHSCSSDVRFKFAPGSTAQERLNMVRMTKNALTALETYLSGPIPWL